jgi:hypothetical protein
MAGKEPVNVFQGTTRRLGVEEVYWQNISEADSTGTWTYQLV